MPVTVHDDMHASASHRVERYSLMCATDSWTHGLRRRFPIGASSIGG